MQEQQHVAACDRGAGIHLRGASARRSDDAIGVRRGELDGVVAAAAVDDDHLGAARAQRRERLSADAMVAASSSTGMMMESITRTRAALRLLHRDRRDRR